MSFRDMIHKRFPQRTPNRPSIATGGGASSLNKQYHRIGIVTQVTNHYIYLVPCRRAEAEPSLY